MQRQWHHPELRLVSTPLPRGRLIKFKPISERSLHPQRRLPGLSLRPFTAFVVFSAFTLIFSLSAMVMRSGSVSFSQIADLREELFHSASRSAPGQFEYASGYSALPIFRSDKEASAQVLYISEMIGTHVPAGDSRELALSIVSESRRAAIDPFFVAALIKSESAFKNHARSHKGAMGLMQLLPNTGKFISERANLDWHGSWKLSDPEYNLKLGIAYIKHLHDVFNGNLEHTLIAYNWGPANLNQALSRREHIPSSTVKYARTIISNQKKWKQDYNLTKSRFAYMDSDFIVG